VQGRASWLLYAAITAVLGCGGADEEAAWSDGDVAPPSDASEPVAPPATVTRAAHTGAALIVEAPPTLQAVEVKSRIGLSDTAVAPERAFSQRLERFAALGEAPLSVVLAEALGPSERVSGGWSSSWRVTKLLRGAALPEHFVLHQARDEERYPSCGMIEGKVGRRDVLVVELRDDGSYRVRHDDLGAAGFLRGADHNTKLTWQMGPALDVAALLDALEVAP
jgi:hypothetical protein